MSRAIVRLAAGSVDLTNLSVALPSARSVRYVFCDPSVGRDGHTIANDAWQLDNFKRNPVFLLAHQSEQPPIGRVTDIGVAGGKLRGTVEFAERDQFPFADTIFQLTKAGFLTLKAAPG